MYPPIEILYLQPDTFHLLDLSHFVRYQVTTQVLFDTGHQFIIKDDYFIDDWDTARKLEIEHHLKHTVALSGIVLLVLLDKKVVGFSCLEPTLFDGYIELSFIHVSKPYRYLKIGKQLFEATKEAARKKGVTKIYIGAHPSVESQSFYSAMGCVRAKTINTTIYNREPLDLQLEYVLNDDLTDF